MNTSQEIRARSIWPRIYIFSKVLQHTVSVKGIIEFGANIGMNLIAIKKLLPEADLAAIEINEKAAGQLRELGIADVHNTSILDYTPDRKYDLVLSKGVLIHINPDDFDTVYSKIYEYSSQYICIAEYYNPSPTEVNYRGHSCRLFKRDFAGEFLEKFPDVELVDYGFAYHKDNNFHKDDINWFLLRK
ncbi:pseudaminic acid biosynthesis-associated methylase [Pseudodesulfovibrio thermohalotolerans]|uniref:pseudaminic acid biosynthesis-associated methylase n=1 Tax=Pseudodesulfovibrio thermohalotolerans TaxID=2880651 RepID=UPI0024415498|nr:pseudaminic acid biosynthesis-associated methylase [Pseudodesulfovibrio thermohalotolerans]WFS61363.1 pseudaminic acid biosynthesis-associated methylase [Pseudodesulfovibrio thermohalotolerans]